MLKVGDWTFEEIVNSQEKAKGSSSCNICDQLAAELGEALIRQQKCVESGEGDAAAAAEAEQIELQLRKTKQHLIDHRRMIHPAG